MVHNNRKRRYHRFPSSTITFLKEITALDQTIMEGISTGPRERGRRVTAGGGRS
uniref:Uncharacterized protein n=1 Tax=Arundo donax TaxID=35708 RepID=A0A0A9B028_ARUDO